MSLIMLQAEAVPTLDLTRHWVGYAGVATFLIAYLLVALESKTHMRKSKPVIIAAGIIWMLAGLAYARVGDTHTAGAALRTNIGSYGELFLFILSAMTFVNTMEERQIFGALRSWLVRRRLTLRAVFWITGIISFFLSSQIDNMTTALVMGTVVLTVGRGKTRFIVPACVNVVVAANAGGAWSPFGDITSLMVWQAGILHFFTFFKLFVPALVAWIIPAGLMSLVVPKDLPEADTVGLFAVTVLLAVSGYNLMGLPPALGMMTGLGLLNVYGYYLRHWGRSARVAQAGPGPLSAIESEAGTPEPFDIFQILQRAEWDTLMFFYGVIVAVGGLDFMGHLARLSKIMYQGLGPTIANAMVGVVSAFVDNIPVMFSVIQMRPDMHPSQWLLVTMTAGIGGSMLSIGSAAGVALMGQSRGQYTFADHLRWTWAVGLGYVAAIGVHLLLLGA
jgi:Na+/H+ antiporter NhaD/arsenite permease-like protein